jgi:hypothetical protein
VRRSGARKAQRSRQLLIQFGGERRRGCLAKGRVRSLPVVVLDPGSGLAAGMSKSHEQVVVQKLFAHAAFKALNLAVLQRFALSDVMPVHADQSAPCEYGVAGVFGAIIADDHAGLALLSDQLGQLSHDAVFGDRGVRHRRKALSGRGLGRGSSAGLEVPALEATLSCRHRVCSCVVSSCRPAAA